jgi:hypothetical protein
MRDPDSLKTSSLEGFAAGDISARGNLEVRSDREDERVLKKSEEHAGADSREIFKRIAPLF